MPREGGDFPCVLLKEQCVTASQGRTNCAISLAWLGFGGTHCVGIEKA